MSDGLYTAAVPEREMTDREKARDLGNQSAALARSIADVLNDTLDALEAAEARVRELECVTGYCERCEALAKEDTDD